MNGMNFHYAEEGRASVRNGNNSFGIKGSARFKQIFIIVLFPTKIHEYLYDLVLTINHIQI